MNPNKIIIVLLCLLCGGRLGAQGQHELSGSIGGSVSFLNYDPAAVNGFSFGGTAGIGYAYLGEHWGIGVGMNAAMYSGKYSASISGATPDLYDSDRDPFTLRYELKDYREVQQIWMLSLPLMLRYHTGMFHAALGGRAGFPFYASYTSQTSTLTTYGVFNAPSIPTLYDPANKGFGKYDDIKSNGTLGLDWAAAFFASAEVGVRWEAGSVAFYTSIYADYALNNIYKKTDNLKPFVGFDNRPDRDYNINPYRPNSVLASHTGNGSEALVSKVNPLSVGIKITVVLFQSDPDYVPAPPTPRPAAQASSGQSRSSGGGGSAAPRRSALGDPSPLEIKPHGDAEVCLYIVGASKKLDNAIIEPDKSKPLFYVLSDAALEYLNEKIAYLRIYQNTHVIIGGQNCCMCMGPISLNMEVARIQAAKNYLMMNGIHPSRISIKVNNPAKFMTPEALPEERTPSAVVPAFIPADSITAHTGTGDADPPRRTARKRTRGTAAAAPAPISADNPAPPKTEMPSAAEQSKPAEEAAPTPAAPAPEPTLDYLLDGVY